jgi:hypothetical protein
MDEDEEDTEDEIVFTTSRSRAGLRVRKPNQCLKFLENGDRSRKRSRAKQQSAVDEVCSHEILL